MIDTSGGVGASSGNPTSAYVAAHAQSSYTDELSHQSSGQFYVFGDARRHDELVMDAT